MIEKVRKFRKRVSIILLVAMFFSICQFETFTGPSHAYAATTKGQKRYVVKELEDKRTENSTTYLNSDGTKTVNVYNSPIRYKDKEGKLVDIDNSIEEISETSKKNKYKNKSNKFDVLFPESINSDEFITLSYGNYQIGLKPKKNSSLETIPAEKQSDEKNPGKINKLKYKNVFENGIDINYNPTDSGLKEDIILTKRPKSNSFQYQLNTPGLIPEKKDDNNVLLKNKDTGEVIGVIPRPYMFDSSEKEKYSEDIEVKVEKSNDKDIYLLTYVLNEKFLQDDTTTYPVTIDPTVIVNTQTIIYDSFVQDRYPTSNYYMSDTLRVGYYDSATGNAHSFVRYELPNINGGIITNASFNAYEYLNYTNSSYIDIYRVYGSWASSTITWNNQPSYSSSYEPGSRVNVYGTGWFQWNITKLVSDWYSGAQANYGFVLKEASYAHWRKFYSAESSSRPYLSVDYNDTVPNPSASAYGNGANSGTGYVNLSWPAIAGAAGYNVAIFNGYDYQYFNVGNVTSWSTSGKRIWPTPAEVQGGRFLLHSDGLGADLPDDPVQTYIRSGGNYQSSHNYWFRIMAYNAYGQASYLYSNGAYPTLPDRTKPNDISNPVIGLIDMGYNTNDSWKGNVSWNQTTDLPQGIGSGISYYKVKLFEVGTGGTEIFIKEVNVPSTQTSYLFDSLLDTKTYKVLVQAFDINGNYTEGTTSNTVYTSDRTAPSAPTSVTLNKSTWTNSTDISVTWAGITDNVGLQNVQYSIDGGTWVDTGISTESGTKLLSLSGLSDGEHTIAIRGIDAQKNYGASIIQKYQKDTVLPTSSISYPINLQAINGIVNIIGSASDINISNWKLEYGIGPLPTSYTLLVSGTTNITNQQIYSWDTTNLSEGTSYTLRLTTTDLAGNIKIASIQNVKSTNMISANPTLQIDSPKDGQFITSQVSSVIYQKSNNGGNIGLKGRLYINSKMVEEEISAGQGLSLDVSAYSEGSINKIYVKATDAGLNDFFSAITYNGISIADTFNDVSKIEQLIDTEKNISNSMKLKLNGASYYTNGSFETKAVSTTGEVHYVKIIANESKPSGTSIAYKASADGGLTWQDIAINTKTELLNKGSNLKIKAILNTTNPAYSPEIYDWQIETLCVNPSQVFTVKLVDEPDNLTAKPNVNYTTLLRWTASTTPNAIYNIYRSETQNFTPSEGNRIASNISGTYWNDFNLNFGKTFYYKITAVIDVNGKPRESLVSNECSAKIVDKNELEKRLGLQNYWGYGQFRTGSGEGYINLSSGNLVYQSVDFVQPGPKLALVMRRSYNNQSSTKTPLGYGWDFSFNTNLLKEKKIQLNEKGEEVEVEIGLILKDGDGTIHRFNKNADGTYSTPKGIYMELKYNPANKQYEINRKDNIKYIFNDRMQLIRFEEPNGNFLELKYDSRGNAIEVKNSVGDITILAYDNEDKLTKVTDPTRKEFNYVYDENSDKLMKMYTIIEGNVEYSEEYLYDSSFENVRAIKDPKKNITSIEYLDKKVSKVIDPSNESFNITYNTTSTALTSSRDKTAVFEYNTDGNITKKTDTLNHSINYEYDSNYNVKKMYYLNKIDGVEKTINFNYTYDTKGNILTIKDPLGNITEFSNYNSFNEVGTVKAPIRTGVYGITTYVYDDKGNLSSTTDPENRSSSYKYDAMGNRQEMTDNFGNKTTYNYDVKGRLTKIIEPLGKTTEVIEYDTMGNPIKIKDALGKITTYEYDLLGRKTSVIYPDGKTEKFIYDLNSNLIEVKNRREFVTKFDYDELDRPEMTTFSDGTTSTTSYTFGVDDNLIVSTIDGGGRLSKKYFDAAGRVVKEESGGTYLTYDYDYIGNMISTKDAENREVKAIYDELNRQIKTVQDPAGTNIITSFTYDLMGNKTSLTDGEGKTAIYDYDKIGRLITVTNTVSGESITTNYSYDIRDGELIINKVTDALGRENFTYLDALGRTVKEVKEGTIGDSERKTTLYEYDLNGNLLKITKPDGNEVNQIYDDINRLKKVTYDAYNYTEYDYDANGNRTLMKDVKDGNSILTSYAYDNLDRLKQFVQDGNNVTYFYDGSSNQTKITYSFEQGTKEIEYKYDNFNRLSSILMGGSKVRDYTYTPSGKIDEINNYRKFDTSGADIQKIDYSYNTVGLPNNISYYDNGIKKEEYSLNFDKRGYITQETSESFYGQSGIDDTKVQKTNEYDEIGRLLNVISSNTNKTKNTTDNKTTSYTYDKVGNRFTMTDGTNTFSYLYDQFNALQNIKKNGSIDSTFTYDINGNQTKEVAKKDVGGTIKDVTTDFVYDKADRLSKLTINDGTTTKNIENFYNGDGQRIKQNDNGYITKYYYDDGSLLFTTDANNSKATENILDPNGVIVASKRFDGIYNNMYFFYNYDIRGSVTNIINPDGNIVKGYSYDEFGGTKEKGDYSFKNDVKFTGAVHDSSSNLYYMNSRFYNPNTGRFLSQDTYSGNAYEPWTQHLYTYTSNNPINFVDPTGHREIYTVDLKDETEEMRSTSLWNMHGYSFEDSHNIAKAKTPKKKQAAIKTAQENKETKEKQNTTGDIQNVINKTANVLDKGATAIAATDAAIGKIQSVCFKGQYFDDFPLKGISKYSSRIGLAGSFISTIPIAMDSSKSLSERFTRIGIHLAVAGVGYYLGGYATAFLGAGLFAVGFAPFAATLVAGLIVGYGLSAVEGVIADRIIRKD